MRDQIQRASGSVMHNIAEGFDGGSNAEFIKFLRYSQRSASEVQSQLYVALVGYLRQDEFGRLYERPITPKPKSAASLRICSRVRTKVAEGSDVLGFSCFVAKIEN
ncbi:MAG: four helix bundle protein [Verrucomicrobiae bacterium]|nr:four helix bundle protein [Verrucomicrobiae bacterium]